MMATLKEKNLPNLPGSATTVTKSGRLSNSPIRCGHNPIQTPSPTHCSTSKISSPSSRPRGHLLSIRNWKATGAAPQGRSRNRSGTGEWISSTSRRKCKLLSSMRCGGSLTYSKKVLQDRVTQADADALRAEEDRLRIRQLESKM